ncbi:RNA-directed DNA polymerase [Abeliophyllum distichum]|uniref:RNA-directed DNA polymerase n=1 Tax=Abeliophyllum distichum TaxID=126358 RepID=A0ABD1Q6Q1_9LAMI
MARGGKQRRLQAELPKTHNAHDTEDARETKKFAAAIASALQMQHNPNKDHSIERATKLGAKVFTCTSDPAMVEDWMDKIEKVFDVMGCPNDKRLGLATFLFEEGANDW